MVIATRTPNRVTVAPQSGQLSIKKYFCIPVCNAAQFTCNSTPTCIALDKYCNGIPDCLQGEDEPEDCREYFESLLSTQSV